MNSGDSACFAHHDLEDCVARLEGSGNFRVLRRLRRRPSVRMLPEVGLKRAVIVDTETTGLDHQVDEVIQLAMVAVDYSVDGGFVAPAETFDQLREPSRPVPSSVIELTGISTAMLTGQTIDPAAVAAFIEPASLIIAHNAAFDRPFCEALFSRFAKKPWACTFREVDWKSEGFEGARLSQLLQGYGLFFDGHRALNDCEAVAELLASNLPRSGRSVMSALLQSARRPRWHVRAVRAPFEARATLKLRGYRWQSGSADRPGVWTTEVSQDDADEERNFLATHVYRRESAPYEMHLVSAIDRYCGRHTQPAKDSENEHSR